MSKLKIAIITILSVVFTISIIMILTEVFNSKKENDAFLDLAKSVEYTEKTKNTPQYNIDEGNFSNKQKAKQTLKNLDVLFRKNSECIGWLTIPDTKVNYPIMQTKENPEKYLNKDFEGKKSNSGVPFVDYRCDLQKDNILIYGHNMKNETMFGGLKKYKNSEYMASHKTIYFQTADGFYEFRVKEVKVTDINDNYYKNLAADKSQKLILSTCYGNSEFERLIIIAEKIA